MARRRMGCVEAAALACKQNPGFWPVRLSRMDNKGNYWEHVVATNGVEVIDLVPELDSPDLEGEE